MKSLSLICYTLCCVAMSLVTACGRSQSYSLPPATAAVRAVMAPGAVGRDLLYVSSGGNVGYVYIYTYPEGRLLGALGGFEGAQGLCVDRVGDIFTPFAGLFGGIDEYAHGGGSRIATLGDPYRMRMAAPSVPRRASSQLSTAFVLTLSPRTTISPKRAAGNSAGAMKMPSFRVKASAVTTVEEIFSLTGQLRAAVSRSQSFPPAARHSLPSHCRKISLHPVECNGMVRISRSGIAAFHRR